ncbi:MAG: hypothetical protein M1382_04000 [Candidatus Marsarchaeota archaeon]|nr:hypothetical protein [Candidatus Marsarchaeota archaeon]
MTKYYYDTGAFGYFLFLGNWEHKYSPTKVEAANMSVFCDEELIYVYTKKGDFSDFGVKITFLEIMERILSINALFKHDNVNLDDIRQKFIYMMGALIQNKVDLRKQFVDYKNGNHNTLKPLDGMDWLHLVVADLLGCNTILTTDIGFKSLSNIWKYLKLDNVRKIIILSSNDKFEKIDEVILE